MGVGEQISRGLDEQRAGPQNKAPVLALCCSPSDAKPIKTILRAPFSDFFITLAQENILSLINMTL